ncbi:hypothetical protein [Brumimicrobium mesophilum]|uniref:hypothetical protein n=1 Tax=Brumimicrobium mesophilum TaxID=392717 RepID=UPI000D142B55|nr:hypothetical protein [Brumimicrobium mesophilum]
MKTTKPFEVIYITGIVTPTAEDGDVLTFLALDDYSKFLFPPQMKKTESTDTEFIDTLVKFFNGINETYDRKIHAQSTIYYTDLPKPFHPFMSSVIMKDDKLMFKPILVEQVFQPIIKDLGFKK